MRNQLDANFIDLPLKGNYFAWEHYLDADLATGVLRNRSGARFVAVPDSLLESVVTVIAEVEELDAETVQVEMGRRWGRSAATMFDRELQAYYGKPVAELPLALASAALCEAFRSHGWGVLRLDLSRYATGVIVAELTNPVLAGDSGAREHITTGFLSGILSGWAGRELDCVQSANSQATGRNTYILTVPERLKQAHEMAGCGRSHRDILTHIEEMRLV